MRPQIGQLVTLRHRYFYVNDVSFHKGESKLTIESIDEETLGQTMEIIWEHILMDIYFMPIGPNGIRRWFHVR